MPLKAALAVCTLLVAAASVMTFYSLALAADGSFQLLRALATGDVFGANSRILGAVVREGAVVAAARAGVTDTHLLSMLLGVGQLVVPAIVWSVAILLARADRLVCAAVSMCAGLSAGTLWLMSVCEIITAASLTVLVAVLLWRPCSWRWRHAALAIVASSLLVASYETALVTGAILGVWAARRATRSRIRAERVGCASVAVLSILSVLVAAGNLGAGRNPTHSQSVAYFVLSLDPWPFYVALAGIVIVIAALGPWLGDTASRILLIAGCSVLIVALIGFDPDTVTAFQARGGAVVALVLLEIFLWWRWIESQRAIARSSERVRPDRLLVVVPVIFVAAVLAVNVQAVRSWSQSFDAFRAGVDEADGVVTTTDALSPDERAVLWGWTGSSLSLIVRGRPDAGLLVDPDPSFVPFPPRDARNQLDDTYTWGG
jgi:hypothetical protein